MNARLAPYNGLPRSGIVHLVKDMDLSAGQGQIIWCPALSTLFLGRMYFGHIVAITAITATGSNQVSTLLWDGKGAEASTPSIGYLLTILQTTALTRVNEVSEVTHHGRLFVLLCWVNYLGIVFVYGLSTHSGMRLPSGINGLYSLVLLLLSCYRSLSKFYVICRLISATLDPWKC